jgi:hypothetical protein
MPANNNTRSDAGRDDARPDFRVDRQHDRVRPTCLTSWTCGFDQAGFPEPTLGELLEDPLIGLLMTSDRVEPGELAMLLATMARSVGWRDGGR